MSSHNHLFWIVAYPRDGMEGSLQSHEKKVGEHTTEYPFHVPDLRVGTLDSLLSLSDELIRIDQYTENVVQKIARLQQEFVTSSGEKDDSKVRQAVEHMASVNGMPFESCLNKFAWDDAKYPTRSTLKEIVSAIHTSCGKIEEELKVKSSEYSAAKSVLTQMSRKAGGNLLVRSLDEFITDENLVPESQESESLQTVFVVVGNHDVDNFFKSYESLMLKGDAGEEGEQPQKLDPRAMCTWVVPRSATVITKDTEYSLVSVIVFKKMADMFKRKCRENTPKFMVREFKYDPSGSENAKVEKTKLVVECDKMKSDLQRWCRVNFGEVFIAWLHLKAVRVFVESVLRYGLPVNFQARLLKLHSKHERKVRDSLKDVFKRLGSSKHFSETKDSAGDASMLGGAQEFFPYVWLGVNNAWSAE